MELGSYAKASRVGRGFAPLRISPPLIAVFEYFNRAGSFDPIAIVYRKEHHPLASIRLVNVAADTPSSCGAGSASRHDRVLEGLLFHVVLDLVLSQREKANGQPSHAARRRPRVSLSAVNSPIAKIQPLSNITPPSK